MASSPVIEKFLEAISSATIPSCDVWSADATLDATVPNWRLHADGADAIGMTGCGTWGPGAGRMYAPWLGHWSRRCPAPFWP